MLNDLDIIEEDFNIDEEINTNNQQQQVAQKLP